MQQNYYVKLDGSGHITDISNVFQQGYIPVAVDLGHISLFQSKNKRVTYNSKKEALEYAPTPPAWGVYYDGGPNPQLKRINKAVGLHAGINGKPNDFDHISPWKDIHEVKDAKGNQYMSIPPFYVHRTQNDQTGAETLEISPKPVVGWYLPKCFIDPKNQSIHNIWVGKYLGNSNGVLSSKTGQSIDTNNALDGFRYEMEQNNPNNSQNGPYALMDIHIWSALQDLFTVEFATLDSKAVFYNEQGDDIKIPTSQKSLFVYEPLNAGTNDNLHGTSNWDSNDGVVNYRGIENLFGYDGTWCDGINLDYYTISLDYTQYNDDGNGYIPLILGNYDVGRNAYNSVSREIYDSRYPDVRLAAKSNGDNNADNYYCNSSYANNGACVFVGGSNDQKGNCLGLWFEDSMYSGATDVASARLVYHPQN